MLSDRRLLPKLSVSHEARQYSQKAGRDHGTYPLTITYCKCQNFGGQKILAILSENRDTKILANFKFGGLVMANFCVRAYTKIVAVLNLAIYSLIAKPSN